MSPGLEAESHFLAEGPQASYSTLWPSVFSCVKRVNCGRLIGMLRGLNEGAHGKCS